LDFSTVHAGRVAPLNHLASIQSRPGIPMK
jgi:hypothetical protein